jgi:hypothetical protein
MIPDAMGCPNVAKLQSNRNPPVSSRISLATYESPTWTAEVFEASLYLRLEGLDQGGEGSMKRKLSRK